MRSRRCVSLADEIEAYAAYLNAWMAHPDDDELTEDLEKAKRALEVAWLEEWAARPAAAERPPLPKRTGVVMLSKLKLPTWLTVGLSVVAGVLSVLNLTVFGFDPVYQELVTVGLAALAVLGISPLTGDALQNVLHISHAAALAAAGAFATATVAVSTSGIDPTVKNVVAAVLTLLGGVLVGPGVVQQPVPVPVPAPAPVPPSPPPAPSA